jgi:hemerythrin-like metal-binding protein
MNHASTIQEFADCGAAADALEAEHDAIEMAVRALQKAVVSGASGGELLEIVTLCIHFCKAHFTNEERFMRDHEYPRLKAHRAAHQEVLEKLEQIRRCALGEEIAAAALDTADLLDDFEEHVRTFDSAAYEEIMASGNRTFTAAEMVH